MGYLGDVRGQKDDGLQCAKLRVLHPKPTEGLLQLLGDSLQRSHEGRMQRGEGKDVVVREDEMGQVEGTLQGNLFICCYDLLM